MPTQAGRGRLKAVSTADPATSLQGWLEDVSITHLCVFSYLIPSQSLQEGADTVL